MKRNGLSIILIIESIILIVVCVLCVIEVKKPSKPRKYEASTQITEDVFSGGDSETEATQTDVDVTTELPEASTEEQAVEEFDEEIVALVENMTVEQKIAQLFVVSPETLTSQNKVTVAGDMTREALDTYNVGGICYTHKNYVGKEQMEKLLSGTVEMGKELMVAPPYIMAWDDNQDGANMLILAKSEDYSTITEALRVENGIKSTVADENTGVILHYPEDKDDIDEETVIVMLSDISEQSVEALREDMDYKGIIMTDNLSYLPSDNDVSEPDYVVEVLQAGVDMLWVTENFKAVYDSVLASVENGEISEEIIDKAICRSLTNKLND
ncbi:MAG: glycoside hydrolase family 3 N-terminal domain-containing protein [Wujia sp.]